MARASGTGTPSLAQTHTCASLCPLSAAHLFAHLTPLPLLLVACSLVCAPLSHPSVPSFPPPARRRSPLAVCSLSSVATCPWWGEQLYKLPKYQSPPTHLAQSTGQHTSNNNSYVICILRWLLNMLAWVSLGGLWLQMACMAWQLGPHCVHSTHTRVHPNMPIGEHCMVQGCFIQIVAKSIVAVVVVGIMLACGLSIWHRTHTTHLQHIIYTYIP